MLVTTIRLVDSEARAGQLVMLAAQLVIVWIWVVRTVNVVCGPEAAVVDADDAATAPTSVAVYEAKSAEVADEASDTATV